MKITLYTKGQIDKDMMPNRFNEYAASFVKDGGAFAAIYRRHDCESKGSLISDYRLNRNGVGFLLTNRENAIDSFFAQIESLEEKLFVFGENSISIVTDLFDSNEAIYFKEKLEEMNHEVYFNQKI